MDFRKGMDCPECGEHHSFFGGSFGGGVNYTNYSCDCGFKAMLVINWKDQWERFEVRGIPNKK